MNEQKPNTIPTIELPSSGSSRKSKNVSPTRSVRKVSTVEQESTPKVNSNTSPVRPVNGTSTLPSAAAVQRALSVAKSASTHNDSSSDTTRERKHRSGQNTPQWPTSPRLKSPPPSSFKSIASRMGEPDQSSSSTSARKPASALSVDSAAAAAQPLQDVSKEGASSQQTSRAPGRGASAQGTGLETVAENSVPTTPLMKPASDIKENPLPQVQALDSHSDPFAPASANKDASKSLSSDMAKASADKAETAPPSRATSTSRPPTNLAKRSFTSLTGKSKPVVEPLRTITVETEPVNSNTQLIADRGRDGGSVRTKVSNETIRPKKEKKKSSRKAPSIHAGMNSSKADIFEAKVATAVGEADSSDSDETFVYESNPPDSRHARHHSRTPSATSLASQVDARRQQGVRNNGQVNGGKKSMKFSNSMYGSQLDTESAGDGRSSTRTTNSTARHHHIGRHGRNGHASIIDTDSPFVQGNRAFSPRTPVTRNSRPNSPRTSNGRLHFARKSMNGDLDGYEDGADDERAPLIGSVRINRTRHSRRPNSSHMRALHFAEDEDPGCWPRYRGCVLLGIIVALVFIAVTVFVALITRDLENVKITQIQNVLASEQTLMLDLNVQAINPNLFTITVSKLDVNIFAESPYVGTTAQYLGSSHKHRPSLADRRKKPVPVLSPGPIRLPPFGSYKNNDHDDFDDPDWDPDWDGDWDPAPGSQKMVLGRIFEFDSALVFPASPIQHDTVSSVGEIRITQPGNKTEVGGSERWERVLQHPFTLIVRGVMKYQLPLSSSIRSTKIGSRISVTPGNSSSDGNDTTNTTSKALF